MSKTNKFFYINLGFRIFAASIALAGVIYAIGYFRSESFQRSMNIFFNPNHVKK